jgi:hypothetical protein
MELLAMKTTTFDRRPDRSLRFVAATAKAPSYGDWQAEAPLSTSRQGLLDFALLWARWEPALVAQQNREWLS